MGPICFNEISEACLIILVFVFCIGYLCGKHMYEEKSKEIKEE